MTARTIQIFLSGQERQRSGLPRTVRSQQAKTLALPNAQRYALQGPDARRLFARAGTSTIDDKRNQVTRIVVGAAASGVVIWAIGQPKLKLFSSHLSAM